MTVHAITWGGPQTQHFIDLPWSIYPKQHRWIPPIKAALLQELSPTNRFFRHGDAQAFIYTDAGHTLGRIVASTDALRRQPEGETIGNFGYFECIDDTDVAAALLNAAQHWLHERGCTHIHGPVDLNIFTRYRLQTDGFDSEPFFGEPRNPHYYPTLLTQHNFDINTRWYSWNINRDGLKKLAAHTQHMITATQPNDSAHYTIETLNDDAYHDALPELYDIGMQAFAENYGFAPIDFDEFSALFSSLRPFLCDGSYGKGLADGQTVGITYGYLDVADAFQHANGDHEALPQALASHPPQAIVYYNFAILQSHRGSSLPYQIFDKAQQLATHNSLDAYGALAKEGPAIYQLLGAPSRQYSIFSKAIGDLK